jgi:hypothetical protein
MCASSARSRQALGFRVSASCRNPVIRPDFSARWRRQVAISLAPTRAIISSIDLSLSAMSAAMAGVNFRARWIFTMGQCQFGSPRSRAACLLRCISPSLAHSNARRGAP